MLLSDGGHDFIRAVGVRGIGQYLLRGIEVIGILMPAEDVDRIAGDAQARTRNQSLIDRVPHRGVRGPGTLRAHVPFGGEAGHQVISRRHDGYDRPMRYGLLHRLKIFGAGMQKQVHVRVNQSGQQRGVAQVDDLSVRRMRDGRSHRGNAFTLNQNLARGNHAPGIDLKQARRVQNHRMAAA